MAFKAFMTALAAWSMLAAASAAAADFMFRARVDDRLLEGQPLLWNAREIVLLGRDGQIYVIDAKKAKDQKKTSPQFFGYSSSEMKEQLQKEFGKQFDVSATRHYLVVHPQGERDQWANRFEDLYKRFGHYFRIRGFTLEEPPYPLVAVVFRNEADYRQYAEANGSPAPPGRLGHYEEKSNRNFLYDRPAKATDWSTTSDTIIHEATHQAAFNTGIHRRFSETPAWLAEGLATMFEARGVWDAQYDRTQSDRINQGRLANFRTFVAKGWQPGTVLDLVSSDRMFQSDKARAYAFAWALSFYLSETQPRLYAQYLARTAERPMFARYTAEERVADFQGIFGNEMKMFETKFLRFMADVK
jgi:hypothetical protein